MSISLQNYITNQFNMPSNTSFLDLTVYNTVAQLATMSIKESNLASAICFIFLLSDIVLYIGIIAIILVLGSRYNKTQRSALTELLLNVSIISIYLAIFLLVVGLYIDIDFIAAHNLCLFENSYSFNFFTQCSKLILLLTASALYVSFRAVYSIKMQSLELPLLLQIAIALSCSIISSSNFALSLLALEGFSLILYVMTALSRSYGGVTAAVKYFAFGTLGSVFLF